MQRVLIIGGNGAGKTTFARELSQKKHLPLVHLDQLYWRGNWECVSKAEFDALLQAELEREQWIIDGNYNRTLPHRLRYCDTVFYFDFSTLKCLWSVTGRVIRNYGTSRPDMGGNCPERFNLSFYRDIFQFRRKHRRRYHNLLRQASGVQVYVFTNRKQAKQYLQTLNAAAVS